jgi:hypothetical protein
MPDIQNNQTISITNSSEVTVGNIENVVNTGRLTQTEEAEAAKKVVTGPEENINQSRVPMNNIQDRQSSEEPLPLVVKPEKLELTNVEGTLIQNTHRGYARVNLEREFKGGYSGTRVFLISPVKSNGASDARGVTKIGQAEDLYRERENYETLVKRALPNTAARVDEYYSQASQAALNYVFMGGGTLGETPSLEEYYHSHTAEEVINVLTDLLDLELAPRWYQQSEPLNHLFREKYLNLPENLETIVAAALPDLSLVEGNRVTLPGMSGTYPDPLQVYLGLLDQTVYKSSLVHGDLHPRNILVDKSGKAWLIDFAKVKEHHNLFDFIKLETYIRLWVLGAKPEFSLNEYVQFEQALNAAALDQKAARLTNSVLAKAEVVIRAIREIARRCMKDSRNFKEEYLPGLFLYCLKMMKYYETTKPAPTRLVFITTCVAGQCLQDPPASTPRSPSSPKPIPTIDAEERADVDWGLEIMGKLKESRRRDEEEKRRIKREDSLARQKAKGEQQVQAFELEERRRTAEREFELKRLAQLSAMSLEGLVAASPKEQAELLADLKKTQILQGWTEEQILAAAAEKSPDVARAFQEKFRAMAEGKVNERERELYERLLK